MRHFHIKGMASRVAGELVRIGNLSALSVPGLVEIIESELAAHWRNRIAIEWNVSHVGRPDLTLGQKREVLAKLLEEHDPTVGVTNDIVHSVAEHLFPQKEEE